MFLSIKSLVTTAAVAVFTMANTVLVHGQSFHDWDDLPLGNTYHPIMYDISQGIPFRADPFYWYGAASPYYGGFSTVVRPPYLHEFR